MGLKPREFFRPLASVTVQSASVENSELLNGERPIA
jgi:hypothetical protein